MCLKHLLFSLFCYWETPSGRTSLPWVNLWLSWLFQKSGYLSTVWIGSFQMKTNSGSTPPLTRPNFLGVPFSFTPLWIFNYTDKELGKHRSPRFLFALSMSDSQVEIPHLSNMGAAPVTVHLITLGPVLSPDATQRRATRTPLAHKHTDTHRKLKWTFSPPMEKGVDDDGGGGGALQWGEAGVGAGWGWSRGRGMEGGGWRWESGWVGEKKSCHFPTPH